MNHADMRLASIDYASLYDVYNPNIDESQPLNDHSANNQEEPPGCFGSVGKVLSFAPSFLLDFTLWPVGALASISVACGYSFNPKGAEIKKGLPPIVLLHGSGFNESEFIIARYFLNKEGYGSVFSFNMERVIGTVEEKDLVDFTIMAQKKIQKYTRLAECDHVIPIGHSMGGIIAANYAENHADADGIKSKHVFTICSPLNGTPTVDLFRELTCGCIASEKRFDQMREGCEFTEDLCGKMLDSEKKKKRTYYNIFSKMDWGVPGKTGKLTENPENVLQYENSGHFTPIVDRDTWIWVCNKLDKIYQEYAKEGESLKDSTFLEI